MTSTSRHTARSLLLAIYLAVGAIGTAQSAILVRSFIQFFQQVTDPRSPSEGVFWSQHKHTISSEKQSVPEQAVTDRPAIPDDQTCLLLPASSDVFRQLHLRISTAAPRAPPAV